MKNVYLRALEFDDLEKTYRWHNDHSLNDTLIGTFHFVNLMAEEEWFKKLQNIMNREVNLAICLKKPSEHIGNVYLRNIDWIGRHAELHIFIGDQRHRGKGYGEAALHQIMDHAFDDLGLLRLYMFVLADNEIAIKVYKKCGFFVEGELVKHAFKNGQFRNVLIMGICREK